MEIPTAHFDKDHYMNPHNVPTESRTTMKTEEEWEQELYELDTVDSDNLLQARLTLIHQIQLDAIQHVRARQLKPLEEMLNKCLGIERLKRIDKEAEEKVGEGVLNNEDIYEIALREYKLDTLKEGMRRAANIAGWKVDNINALYPTPEQAADAILTAADALTEKDLM